MRTSSIDRVTLLNITIFVEAFLLLTATFWTRFAGIELLKNMEPDPHKILLGAGAGLALSMSSFLLYWLGRVIKALKELREIIINQIAPIFSALNPFDVLLVAAVSGFCEEVLFRGVMQQQFDLIPTSIIFGLFHCPSFRHISYGLWAFAAGLFLGWLYIYSGNLWVPIMAHAVSNAVSLYYLRYGIPQPLPADDNPPPPEDDAQD